MQTACLLAALRSLLVIGFCVTFAAAADERPRTFFVTRSLAHEKLLPYLDAARPEIVQIGNYGAMFHGYADNPRSTRSPMMLPVVGERAVLEFQRKLNAQVHERGLKVVGHFRVIKVMADWKQQSGFVEYYNKRWPEDLLGPRPHPDLKELLQRDVDGEPIQLSRYDNAQLALCLSSPHARQMLKQMLKCAIEHGVDGVITTYNYRRSCACQYCRDAFRQWLITKGKDPKLADNEIPAQIPGYPEPDAGDLEWLALQWGTEHFKEMYDDIFVKYGRSLRKDLIVAQWNHLSHVSIREERMFLPKDQWGRGENYFWYSGGAAFVRRNLNLSEGKAGDAWLSGLYVRELSGNRPFVLGKYDGIRLAVSMAEGYALNGLGMGRYMRFEDPTGFDVLVRYTNFMHRHRHLYDNARPFADAGLVLPRQSVWNRRPETLDAFRTLGQKLLERQILLDVIADESLTPERLANLPAVILPGSLVLTDRQSDALRQYAAAGGVVIEDAADTDSVDAIVSRLADRGASVINAPWTVRATAYTQPDRTILHLVNYDRDESPDNTLKGPQLERPRAVENIDLSLRLPSGRDVRSVMVVRPESDQPLQLPFKYSDGRVHIRLPRLLVYAVIAVEF